MEPEARGGIRHEGRHENGQHELVDLLRDDSSDDDDDFFLHGPSKPSLHDSLDPTLSSLRAQVNNVTKVMWSNVERVVDRGDRMEDLENRSQNLQEATVQFQASSDRVMRKTWWKNRKVMAVSGTAVLVMVIIIIIATA